MEAKPAQILNVSEASTDQHASRPPAVTQVGRYSDSKNQRHRRCLLADDMYRQTYQEVFPSLGSFSEGRRGKRTRDQEKQEHIQTTPRRFTGLNSIHHREIVNQLPNCVSNIHQNRQVSRFNYHFYCINYFIHQINYPGDLAFGIIQESSKRSQQSKLLGVQFSANSISNHWLVSSCPTYTNYLTCTSGISRHRPASNLSPLRGSFLVMIAYKLLTWRRSRTWFFDIRYRGSTELASIHCILFPTRYSKRTAK